MELEDKTFKQGVLAEWDNCCVKVTYMAYGSTEKGCHTLGTQEVALENESKFAGQSRRSPLEFPSWLSG